MKKLKYIFLTIVLLIISNNYVYADFECDEKTIKQMANIVCHEYSADYTGNPSLDFYTRITTMGVLLNNINRKSGNTLYEKALNLTDNNYADYSTYKYKDYDTACGTTDQIKAQMLYMAALTINGKYALPSNVCMQAADYIVKPNAKVWDYVPLPGTDDMYFGSIEINDPLSTKDIFGRTLTDNTSAYYRKLAKTLMKTDYTKYTASNACSLTASENPTVPDDDDEIVVPKGAWKETCYYMANKFKAKLVVKTGSRYKGAAVTNGAFTDVFVNKVGDRPQNNPENVLNWIDGSWTSHTTTGTNPVVFSGLYKSEKDAAANGTCPEYLVIQYCSAYKIWGVKKEDKSIADQAVEAINSDSKCVGYLATFKNSDGAKITEDEYYSSFVHKDLGGEDIDELECYGENSLFGDKDDEGIIKRDGTIVKPPSLAYMINRGMGYVRIIVPILIILLGTLDLAKAALASDQEKMKKAQKDFLKRIFLGVVIFFIPTIVNLVMNLADLVWEGLDYNTPCMLP